MKKNLRLASIAMFLFCYTINSQDLTNNLKIWSGVSLKYKTSKNLDIKFNQLLSYNVTPSGFSFTQTKLALAYKLKRRTYIEAGYVKGLFNDSRSLRNSDINTGWFNKLAVNRVYTNFSFKHDIVKRLALRHKTEFQYFFKSLEKYQTRFTYAARLSYNVRRTSFSPYIENQFFYYAGGDIGSGVKRYRFKTGFNFKPIKDSSMGVSVYYISQNEYNTAYLPQNDYSVLGLSLSFTIK